MSTTKYEELFFHMDQKCGQQNKTDWRAEAEEVSRVGSQA
jgi:hypothetical protein